jgi:hypothetical protein
MIKPNITAVLLPPPSRAATPTINPPSEARRTAVFIEFLNMINA